MPVKTNIAKNALRTSARLAPAVGLLLFGERAFAQIDQTDDVTDFSVPEPSTLALLAAGAVAAGVGHAIKKRRRK